MNRRSFGLAALCTGALLVGTLLGGQAGVPRAHAKSAASQSEEAADAPANAKKKAATVCKTSKDCPKEHACVKTGDHRECTPVLAEDKIPVAT